jgi:hypothetical protein
MSLAAFTPTGQAALVANGTSQNVAVPLAGTPTQVLLVNLGLIPVFVVLGTSNAVVATVATGTPILPGCSLPLVLGANTYLAAITTGDPASLHISAGT